MRQGLTDSVEHIAKEELEVALLEHGDFRNYHEAYAIMKEEIEEAEEMLVEIKKAFDIYWESVKTNNSANSYRLEQIRTRAINMACEATQVAAMAQKALRIERELIERRTVIENADT